MTQSNRSVFVDQAIAAALTALIEQAEEYVVLVTPYLKIDDWGHMKRAIELATKRGVRVTFLVRASEGRVTQSNVSWLLAQNVRVLEVALLHAKIYMNEKSVLVSSMNLLDFSARNSLEIALIIRNQDDAKQVRQYVVGTLMELAKPIERVTEDAAPVRRSVIDTLKKLAKPIPRANSGPTRRPGARRETQTGFCIRCSTPIALDSDRPLCGDDYDVWAEYGNKDYEEKYCHSCGRPWGTSYAKPLCESCFLKVVR